MWNMQRYGNYLGIVLKKYLGILLEVPEDSSGELPGNYLGITWELPGNYLGISVRLL